MKYLFTPLSNVDRNILKILGVGQVLFLVGLWATASLGTVPSPIEVLSAIDRLARTEGLLFELGSSAFTNLQALIISSLFSMAFVYLSTIPFFKPTVALYSGLRFLGLAGITFLVTLWLGGGEVLKLTMLIFGMTVFMVTNMSAEVANIPSEQYDHAYTLGMSKPRIVYEVVVRGTLSNMLDIIRQNAAIGWMMLSMVEGLVRSGGGIGAMLLNQNKHLHLDAVFGIQLTILAVGLLIDYMLAKLQYLICPYAALNKVK